jgi:hypothetical protein
LQDTEPGLAGGQALREEVIVAFPGRTATKPALVTSAGGDGAVAGDRLSPCAATDRQG